jgi:hypothetical protein
LGAAAIVSGSTHIAFGGQQNGCGSAIGGQQKMGCTGCVPVKGRIGPQHGGRAAALCSGQMTIRADAFATAAGGAAVTSDTLALAPASSITESERNRTSRRRIVTSAASVDDSWCLKRSMTARVAGGVA